VRWWFGQVEQRVGVPDLIDVVDAVGVVFEQVGGLSVDLERVGVVQPVEIEQLTHAASVLQTDTNVEGMTMSDSSWTAHRRARVGVAGGFLDVTEWDAGVERCGDERVAQTVRRDALVDPGALHEPLDHPIRAVPVHSSAFDAGEDRPHRPLTDVQIQRPTGARCDGDSDVLAALAHDRQRTMPALCRQIVDVGIQRFGDPQPIQRQQRHQRTVTEIAEPSLHEERAEFVAIQAEGA
jgi:hypothetical protein